MQEQWLPIDGYETLYEVSNLGKVRNKHGKLIKGFHQLKPSGLGYWRTTLTKKQKGKHFQTHRLVAAAFIPNPENKPQVNHIDYNSINNNVENLEWCTASENERHSRVNKRNATKSSVAGKASAQKKRDYKLGKAKENLDGVLIGYWKILKIVGWHNANSTEYLLVDMVCTKCNSNKIHKDHRYTKQFMEGNTSLMCKSCRSVISNKKRKESK